MHRIRILVALFTIANALVGYSSGPTIDDFAAVKSTSGYPHSIYRAFCKLVSVRGHLKLYYDWTAKGPSMKDPLTTTDVDPSKYESWIRGQLPITEGLFAEVVDKSAADAIVRINVIESISFPNNTWKDLLIARRTVAKVQIIDVKTSVVLARNELSYETIAVAASSPRKGETKVVENKWNDNSVTVHLATKRIDIDLANSVRLWVFESGPDVTNDAGVFESLYYVVKAVYGNTYSGTELKNLVLKGNEALLFVRLNTSEVGPLTEVNIAIDAETRDYLTPIRECFLVSALIPTIAFQLDSDYYLLKCVNIVGMANSESNAIW